MKINRVLLLGLILIKSVFVAASQERCVPVGMLCEYLNNPLGIDALHPRLRWHLDDVRDKAMQKACRVLVSTDSLKLADKNYADCWDTGKRKTETMQFVYNGKKLLPFTKYFWKVEVWDKDGNKTSSDIASFETGMLEMHNWRGSWISDGRDMDYTCLFTRKFYWNGRSKSRHSRIIRNCVCPLTGDVTDTCILKPFIEFLSSHDFKTTYSQLIDQCIGSMFSAWHEEFQLWADDDNSVRGVLMDDLDTLYYSDGTVYSGPLDLAV